MAQSAYERYGGFPVVRKVVSDFYDRVLDEPVLAHHFEGVAMPRLIDHQTKFVAFLMGGPVSDYSDEYLKRVHERLNISLDEFDEVVQLLDETLEDHGVDSDDRARIAMEFRRREHIIVSARNGDGPGTG